MQHSLVTVPSSALPVLIQDAIYQPVGRTHQRMFGEHSN